MIYVRCPRMLPTTPPTQCDADVVYEVKVDYDDYRRYVTGVPTTPTCEDGHELTADEWLLIAPEADRLAYKDYYW